MGELAKEAYIAYGEKVYWMNYRGDPMPTWEELPDSIREAWRAAVDAVVAIVGGGAQR
jgi:hypothetical protein